MFSFQNLTNFLSQEFAVEQKKFITSSFFKAAKLFYLFGFSIICLLYLDDKFQWSYKIATNQIGIGVLSIISFVLGIWYCFCFGKYRNNVLNVSQNHVIKTYVLLFLSNVFIIWFLLTILKVMLDFNFLQTTLLVGAIFGTSSVVYLIPAAIGMFFINRNSAIQLKKFLIFCFWGYLAIFSVFLTCYLFFSISQSTYQMFDLISLIIMGVFVFVSPVLTWYRFFNVSQVIDYSDETSVQKWKNLFVLEIIYEMVQIVIWIIRILLRSRR